MAAYAVCKKENICTTFDTILRRLSFILMFFQDLTFLLSVGNPKKSQKVTPQEDADCSKVGATRNSICSQKNIM